MNTPGHTLRNDRPELGTRPHTGKPRAGSLPQQARRVILRARVVMPLCSPAMDDGAVLISGRKILSVKRWSAIKGFSKARVVDLGETVLFPGFVNAHCHLDYTDMAGHFPPPRVFTDWLKAITEVKAGWSFEDFAHSWRRGAEMLLRTGTTTVADIEALPQLLPEAWDGTFLRVVSFLEMIGIAARRPPALVLQEALDKVPGLRHARCRPGLSPHAPYSTVPELLRLAAKAAKGMRIPLCVHVAESALEFQMFHKGSGPMYEWMRRSGRDMSDCNGCSPVQHLENCRILGSNLLATHVNYLGRKDAALLARRGAHVVHCPRSHHYFGHDAFPLRRLRRAGVNVCLGTDSLASVWKSRQQEVRLSMPDEMRMLAKNEPGLSPEQILRMATLNGARALGAAGQIGQLSAGASADLVAIPFSGRRSQAADAILQFAGEVSASMIDGVWAIAPEARKVAHPEFVGIQTSA